MAKATKRMHTASVAFPIQDGSLARGPQAGKAAQGQGGSDGLPGAAWRSSPSPRPRCTRRCQTNARDAPRADPAFDQCLGGFPQQVEVITSEDFERHGRVPQCTQCPRKTAVTREQVQKCDILVLRGSLHLAREPLPQASCHPRIRCRYHRRRPGTTGNGTSMVWVAWWCMITCSNCASMAWPKWRTPTGTFASSC